MLRSCACCVNLSVIKEYELKEIDLAKHTTDEQMRMEKNKEHIIKKN